MLREIVQRRAIIPIRNELRSSGFEVQKRAISVPRPTRFFTDEGRPVDAIAGLLSVRLGNCMPKYYFHIRANGVLEEDLEGGEFPSLDEAYMEALESAREMIAEKVLSNEVIDGQIFEIVDEDGVLLRQVPFKSAIRLE